ncbi:capsule biosynthesis protein CapK [Massilia sp. YIM B02443]|uniref:capsule biosynthesis protein CapK n=1 Tax=Massilia sp. YIM B02443 TaxID=3050127 RepID=UPI0025B6F788|nr:capsule biosynthesis protein CapK [Massilia sp. YIM B02443]MDN4039369.1 capsule biosynthesis protein CapK [Massilia sp. YIM B02443]
MNAPGTLDALHRERFPTLTPDGQRMLDFLHGHPCAPLYRNRSGNRLLQHEVEAQLAYERAMATAPIGWSPGQPPGWVMPFVARAYADVPYYRAQGAAPRRLADVRPIGRAELAADVAQFVPDDAPLARMMQFRTTGTTGNPLVIPSHPVVAARYAAFHKRALGRIGIAPSHGRGQVGVVLLGFQQRCFTYVSVTPTMDESGLAKINLHPDDWRHPDHRATYLDALAPEIVAGDPISFTEYLTLPTARPPRALISVSMQLMPGLRTRLEQRFGCPVLDIYSLGEVGPVGVFDAALGGHLLLQPGLYVELLDRDGAAAAPGVAGEITVTGGFNFCLPLLRYRTGDHATLATSAEGPVLIGLSGRRPVRFLTLRGWVNNIDVTHALEAFPISHFNLHQDADRSVTLRLAPAALGWSDAARAALEGLFGTGAVRVQRLDAQDKTLQYTSDVAGAHE